MAEIEVAIMTGNSLEEPLVRVENVRRNFGKEEVLKGVDFEVPRGSVTALLGRNGSGKSTLMNILIGLLNRDHGEVEVLGHDPENCPISVLNRMAYVNDNSAVWPWTKVKDELKLVKGLRGDRWNDDRAHELLTRFDISVNKRVQQLSKGMLARLRIILALASDPELILLDEPALGLDLFARRDLLEVMIETVEKEDRAILISSHLIDDVERVADRVIFLKDGLVVAQGGVEDLRQRYRRARFHVTTDDPHILKRCTEGLLGVRRVLIEPGSPHSEQVVIFDDFNKSLLAKLESNSNLNALETRRMSLREIYFEVLGGNEGEF
ncbi:MAG: ABC transporter ATP-binding protein [Planctomycetota bacterium]|nr:ABC transporter ATP-binding protein [Planctomycetota bacterium]